MPITNPTAGEKTFWKNSLVKEIGTPPLQSLINDVIKISPSFSVIMHPLLTATLTISFALTLKDFIIYKKIFLFFEFFRSVLISVVNKK